MTAIVAPTEDVVRGRIQVDENPTGVLSPGGRDRRFELRAVAQEVANLAARLMFLSANLQVRLTDATDRAETTALLDDSTQRLQELARKLREMDKDV